MKLPTYKRIRIEDFSEEERMLIEKLALSINDGFSNVYDALNNKLTFRDNFAGTAKEFTVSTDVNGTPTGTTEIRLDSITPVFGFNIIFVNHVSNPNIYPNSAVQIFGVQNKNIFRINKVTGLPANQSFNIRVQVFY